VTGMTGVWGKSHHDWEPPRRRPGSVQRRFVFVLRDNIHRMRFTLLALGVHLLKNTLAR
jgi:hypothetical protein